ncbi:hypothetical protein [Streptomyces sp. NPDC006463]|uniref:hypothetical protein n=1 Tax=Streptomyces sp. NPDC006463 TaxID=3364746 RepID=UPI0036A3AE70
MTRVTVGRRQAPALHADHATGLTRLLLGDADTVGVPGVARSGFVVATSPLLAVLVLGHLGFPPWQYGLAFGVCPASAAHRIRSSLLPRRAASGGRIGRRV